LESKILIELLTIKTSNLISKIYDRDNILRYIRTQKHCYIKGIDEANIAVRNVIIATSTTYANLLIVEFRT